MPKAESARIHKARHRLPPYCSPTAEFASRTTVKSPLTDSCDAGTMPEFVSIGVPCAQKRYEHSAGVIRSPCDHLTRDSLGRLRIYLFRDPRKICAKPRCREVDEGPQLGRGGATSGDNEMNWNRWRFVLCQNQDQATG